MTLLNCAVDGRRHEGVTAQLRAATAAILLACAQADARAHGIAGNRYFDGTLTCTRAGGAAVVLLADRGITASTT